MTARISCLGCIALIATFFVHDGYAQSSTLSGAAAPIEMVVVDANGREKQLSSFEGVMESAGLPAGGQIEITLVASENKAGMPVLLAPLDGGEILAPSTLSVANDGTVGFTFKAGQTRGLYRVLVTVGPYQYELQLYAVTPPETVVP